MSAEIDALVETVRKQLLVHDGEDDWTLRAQEADAALIRLAHICEQQAQRLEAYETPGRINSVQKVMEERERAERAERICEQQREAMEAADAEITGNFGAGRAQSIIRAALALTEEQT